MYQVRNVYYLIIILLPLNICTMEIYMMRLLDNETETKCTGKPVAHQMKKARQRQSEFKAIGYLATQIITYYNHGEHKSI